MQTVVATCMLRLLSGCAIACFSLTSSAAETRVHLGGKSFLEVIIPDTWEFRVAYAQPPAVQAVTLFEEGEEVARISPIVWNNRARFAARSAVEMLAEAKRLLLATQSCKAGIPPTFTQHVGGALASCQPSATATPSHGATRVGVLVTQRLSASFALLTSSASTHSELEAILRSVQHFSFENEA
jgi:hypothetical protein